MNKQRARRKHELANPPRVSNRIYTERGEERGGSAAAAASGDQESIEESIEEPIEEPIEVKIGVTHHAIRVSLGGGCPAVFDRHEGDSERHDIAEEVNGVGDEGQAVHEDPDNQLRQAEPEQQHPKDHQTNRPSLQKPAIILD